MLFFTITGIIVWSLVALFVIGCILAFILYAGLCWYRFYRLRQIMLRRDYSYSQEHPPWSVPLFKGWLTVTWRFMIGRYAAEYHGVIVPLNPFGRLRHRSDYWR